jgi:uracil-DNA glycosylase family 4
MTPKTPSTSPDEEYRAAWKTLDLLEDWLTTGYTRAHAALIRGDDEASPRKAAGVSEAVSTAGQDRLAALAAVAAEVAPCVKCGLSANRTMTVPGEGPLDPHVLFIGEGPGAEEDRTGRPFVGAAGQYLNTWLPPIGLARDQCFIANCVKCRPPQNREPHPDEITACLPYLVRQIVVLRPRVICCLGRIAAQTLLSTTTSLGELRGRVHELPHEVARFFDRAIPIVVTYHPSAVLRDKASLRKPVWDDLKLLKSLLEK